MIIVVNINIIISRLNIIIAISVVITIIFCLFIYLFIYLFIIYLFSIIIFFPYTVMLVG